MIISKEMSKLTNKQRNCLHAFVLVFFLMVSDLTTIPSLLQHCETVSIYTGYPPIVLLS